MKQVTRREFLKIASLMGGATLFAGCHLFAGQADVPPYLMGAPGTDPVEDTDGVLSVYSTCGLCPGNCGICCRVSQGTLVKIGGSPYNPISTPNFLPFDTTLEEALPYSGAICPIGGSGIQTLYDPFRVVTPLKRSGPRGSGRWQSISWEQAISEIAGALTGTNGQSSNGRVSGGNGPTPGLSVLPGRTDWGSMTFLQRFAASYPGGRVVRDPSTRWEQRLRRASDAVFGSGTGAVAPSYGTARAVISFGDAPLDSGVPLVSIARSISDARVSGQGFRWAVVDPRLSTSASKSDFWVPIAPGRDVDLALGIMRALAQNHFDRVQFPDDHLRDLVMARSLIGLADGAGVSVSALNTLAEFLAQAGPLSAVVPGRGILAQTNGQDAATLILALNGMVGSQPGTGGLTTSWLDFVEDAEEKLLEGASPPVDEAEAVTEGEPLITWRADPVYHEPAEWHNRLVDQKRIPLFVAVDTTITETAALADYILPDTTYLERWDVCLLPAAVQGAGLGVRAPVVGTVDPLTHSYRPVFPGTRPMEEIFAHIATAVHLSGFSDETATAPRTAWSFFEQTLRVALDAMEAHGVAISASDDEIARVVARGGVFFSEQAVTDSPRPNGAVRKSFSTVALNLERPLPGMHGLDLISYSLPFHRAPRAGLNPWLLEIVPENRLLISARDAETLGIANLDRVTVSSTNGNESFQSIAQIIPGMRPGVVALADGFGYRQSGASRIAINGNATAAFKPAGAGANAARLRTRGKPLRVIVSKA